MTLPRSYTRKRGACRIIKLLADIEERTTRERTYELARPTSNEHLLFEAIATLCEDLPGGIQWVRVTLHGVGPMVPEQLPLFATLPGYGSTAGEAGDEMEEEVPSTCVIYRSLDRAPAGPADLIRADDGGPSPGEVPPGYFEKAMG